MVGGAGAGVSSTGGRYSTGGGEGAATSATTGSCSGMIRVGDGLG